MHRDAVAYSPQVVLPVFLEVHFLHTLSGGGGYKTEYTLYTHEIGDNYG